MVARPPEAACLGQLEASLADPPAAVSALGAFPPAILEAALRSLTQQHGQDALPLLSALAEQASTKAVRKLARREIYRLAQSGVQIPSKAPKPVVERHPERPLRAWASGIDGSGSRAVWILFDGGFGEWDLCSLVINDQAGILEAAGGPISKKRLEAELRAVRERQKLPWVEIPASRGVGLVIEAIQSQDPAQPLSPAFARWRHHFRPPADPSAAEPALPFLVESSEDPTLVDHSPELLELPELAGWFLDPQAVQADAVELLQARESRLVVSEQVKAEREAAILERAIEREFAGAARHCWARRLAEMAWVFHAVGRERQAKIADATARLLAAPTRPAHLIPFVRALAQRGLELACQVALGKVSAAEVSRAPRPPERAQ